MIKIKYEFNVSTLSLSDDKFTPECKAVNDMCEKSMNSLVKNKMIHDSWEDDATGFYSVDGIYIYYNLNYSCNINNIKENDIDKYGNIQSTHHTFNYEISESIYSQINKSTIPSIIKLDRNKLFDLGITSKDEGENGIKLF